MSLFGLQGIRSLAFCPLSLGQISRTHKLQIHTRAGRAREVTGQRFHQHFNPAGALLGCRHSPGCIRVLRLPFGCFGFSVSYFRERCSVGSPVTVGPVPLIARASGGGELLWARWRVFQFPQRCCCCLLSPFLLLIKCWRLMLNKPTTTTATGFRGSGMFKSTCWGNSTGWTPSKPNVWTHFRFVPENSFICTE